MLIPALGVDGACLSVIGRLGERLDVLIFRSLYDFEAFVAAAESGPFEQSDRGQRRLAGVDFDPATELPPSIRRETMQHGWAGRERRRLSAGRVPRPGRHAAAAGRARRRERRCLRCCRSARSSPSTR